ncbi:CarD family transcriptional regulator [Treponema phagedenis]|uniref:CarD family transcriptional regulator n=1 Tax=Treponema phagedenis TaxID=162 RepID=A0A0B7GUN2_TREPH|nr:CarD family transcriptional regulator [Treponema phagedenis]NVP23572.1 CarD family transcriptional regulator [Treponema phagedenis]QEJ94547.1 CarD family transcriptional regulator [Treponema phagedenis]QEJ98706.1 CarD family transcriptional regulator [Treponema phagedenis]QEK01575.1 CarD family transcriptional regulator [Treponema phagedenis]QEK04212.1 CarD family transcriptional regulator [Treponema phagedenis]
MSKKFTFAVNQKVVYPGQGVGEITEICKKEFKEEMLQYYVIYLEDSDMTMMVPVMRAEELGIRTIVSKKDAESALDFLSKEVEQGPLDWKMRYQMNLDLFKSGGVLDNATIVRSLYHRSKIKELPIQERKLYDSAYRIFEDEISAALGLPQNEIKSLIHTYLEKFSEEKSELSEENLQDDFDDDLDDEDPFDSLDADDEEDFDDE